MRRQDMRQKISIHVERKYRVLFCCTSNKHKINWPEARQNVCNKFDLQYRIFVWTAVRRRDQRKEIQDNDNED